MGILLTATTARTYSQQSLVHHKRLLRMPVVGKFAMHTHAKFDRNMPSCSRVMNIFTYGWTD